jgi:Ran GTPase-activating protein (RanGAP) involved in mRNA processing and transport
MAQQAGEKMWYGWPEPPDHNPESTMTTPKRNNFAVDLADLERKLATNITSTSTSHVKRWNPPATQHNQSANKISKPNIAVASKITPPPTNTHSVTTWTTPETLQHDGVLLGEQHNAHAPPTASVVTPQRKNAIYDKATTSYVILAGETIHKKAIHHRNKRAKKKLRNEQQNTSVDVAIIPHRDNTLKNDSKIERVKCITTNNKNLRDEDLDEIINEMETSTVLMEVNLCRNQITLANGRFTAALASNTSLLKINLHCNKIGDEGVRSLCVALKVNNTLRYINLNGNQISKVGAQFLAEALMINALLDNFSLQSNNVGDVGVQRLCAALKVNNTLRCINLNGNQISKVGAQFLAEALMVNTSLVNITFNSNMIGDKGAQSLCDALKVNKTLTSINLSCNKISKVGAKYLAEALMVNTSLLSFNLSSNKINDEGAQSLAESFTVNRSLCNVHLCNNKITDIGATKLADAIEFNCDCVVTMMNLKNNQVSTRLLDRIESISKAKESSKSIKLSLNDTNQTPGQKARDMKRNCKLQIVDSIASKDDQIASLKEHIALLEKDIACLNDNLRHNKPIVETIDPTTDEAERATKRSRLESNVKSNLAIMYEQNQKIVRIKQENVATQLANDTVMSTFKELRGDLEDAHKILHEQTQRVIHIKKEKMDTEMALESIRVEKNIVEADLKEVKEDLEDANELVGQMSLTTDIWQGRFDELVALMQSGKADGASINAIRNRPLGSGK